MYFVRTLLIAILAALPLAAESEPVNLSFEMGEFDKLPTGWSISYSAGRIPASAALTNENCRSGQFCALVTPPSSAGGFAMLWQPLNASAYRSQTIRFRAAVRTEGGAGNSVRLWGQAVGANGAVLFNINSPENTSADWTYSTVDIPVDTPAAVINIGFLVFGAGRAWVDDASFEIKRRLPAEAPRELSQEGLLNITAFAQVLGYVRHFHPSDQAAHNDWEYFTIANLPLVESAASAEELASRLQEIFGPVAPTVQIFAQCARPPLPPELDLASSTDLRAVRWNHQGVDVGDDSVYKSTREYVSTTGTPLPVPFEPPAHPYEASLPRGLTARVPLTLYADSQGTLPALAEVTRSTFHWSADDRATRLAGVILAWNALQHFYPYFDVVDTDWGAALAKALISAAVDTGTEDYIRTLSAMVSAQRDGHGYAHRPPGTMGPGVAPLAWDWVEDQLVVTLTHAAAGGQVTPGDRILKIYGEPVEEVMAAQRQFVSGATPQWILWRTLRTVAECRSGRIRLELEPFNALGTTRTVELGCVPIMDWRRSRGAVIDELEPGIFYVDPNRLTAALWFSELPRLASAEGIIFDLREHPQTHVYLSHLSTTPLATAQWHMPVPSKPDRTGFTFLPSFDVFKTVEPYLNARRVFLTGGGTVSFGETIMGVVEHYKLAEIVGEPTAGTNGNINRVHLPGGFKVSFTGLKVLKTDGSQHHGVGIQPTVPARSTRQGIAEGKDEVLLRGLEVVKRPVANQ